jgi:TatD DNase family protein
MNLSDSHCHLDRGQPEQLAKVLEQARVKRVNPIISMAMSLDSSAETIRLAKSHNGVFAAVGIHPWNAVVPTEEVRQQLSQLVRQKGVVALGEIGLDYARTPQTKETQKELLIYELSLAQETGLPVNIHCRDAHQDMMTILRKEMGPNLKGIIHGFHGDQTMLKDWLALGFYVSIGVRGFVTDELPHLVAAVREIPRERLLTETDSSATGQSTGPADVLLVVEKLAAVRREAINRIATATTANLKRIFKL